METGREGNDLEERYINVHRGGKRQAPPARKPQGRPRREHVDYDDEFYDDPYYDDYDRGGYGGGYDDDYDPPPEKNLGTPGTAPGMPPPIKSTRSSAPAPRWGGCAAGSIAWWWYCRP